ncbi:RNA polymerase II nuclear localization protein IWR1 [Cyberlindnera fabianii]|nr:RNA polymerase II nuclear localization protein IWR1 [Cyberlindnera fabianii]
MLSSLLTSDASSKEGSKPLKRRKNKSTTAQTPAATTSSFELEYVYDIYYRDKAVYETWEKERIGYIKFEEDYDDNLGDDESEKHLSDDEDSNAEDFYKNDYPEDEDDHSTTDEDDDPNASFEKLTESLHKDAAANSPRQTDEFEDLYDEFYDDEGNGPTNFLASLDDGDNDDDDDEMDMDEGYEADYPRQNFFPDEEDDELAKHRDKIFGKLQRMIDEE